MSVILSNSSAVSTYEKWFDDFVAELRSHQLQIETDTASPDLVKFYETITSSDANAIVSLNKTMVQEYFVKRILFEYLKLISNNVPSKLAFDYNDSQVLVWAEVENLDDSIVDDLIGAEAKVNAKYHQYGFDMDSFFVERPEGFQIPSHYKIYKA